MKKSNRLFFIFLVVLSVLMVVHNLLLQAQYAKGNLVLRKNYKVHTVERPLKPFRHLVFNGKPIVNIRNNPFLTSFKRFELYVKPEEKPHLVLNSAIDELVKQRYSNDTLYVWFEINRLRSRDDLSSYDDRELSFFAPSLSSISIQKARVNIASVTQQEPLKVMIDNSYETTFSEVELPGLFISAEKSTVNFSQTMKVDSLWFEGIGQCTFFFNVPHQFGKVVQGAANTQSRISINGGADNMFPLLNKQ